LRWPFASITLGEMVGPCAADDLLRDRMKW
jgi:hypothetical protein